MVDVNVLRQRELDPWGTWRYKWSMVARGRALTRSLDIILGTIRIISNWEGVGISKRPRLGGKVRVPRRNPVRRL